MAAEKQVIRSIRKGTVQWNEDDRLQLVTLLAKAGYSVRIGRQPIPGKASEKKNARMEYTVEFWEEENADEPLKD